MKKITLFLFLLIFPFVVYGEEFKLEWQKAYDGINNITPLKDGGFIEATTITTYSDGKRSISAGYIKKYNNDGVVIWEKQYDYINGSAWFDKIIETKDGDYVVIGKHIDMDEDKWLINESEKSIIVKYNNEGTILWEKEWEKNNVDILTDLIEMQDGSYIVIGHTNYTDIDNLSIKGEPDAIFLRYDKDGNLLWKKTWGGNGNDSLNKIILTKDGGFTVIGQTDSTDIVESKGSNDAIIVKYDKEGNMMWQKNWGGKSLDYFNSIIETETGEYVIVGRSKSEDITDVSKYYGSGIIIKMDKKGNIIWQNAYTEGENIDYYDVIEVFKNGYITIGNPYNNCTDALIVMYDYNGEILWKRYWEERNNEFYDYFYQIIKLSNGDYLVRGETESNNFENNNLGVHKSVIVKYAFKYGTENITQTTNGTPNIEQKGTLGVITPNPNEGYKVEKVIIKDKEGNVLDVEVTEQEDGTLTFPLYTDVSVEVIYALAIDNPKTGILDVMTILFVGIFMSLSGFFIVKKYNERLEL